MTDFAEENNFEIDDDDEDDLMVFFDKDEIKETNDKQVKDQFLEIFARKAVFSLGESGNNLYKIEEHMPK